MGKNTLIFDNIRVNKKEFHKYEQPVDIDLINVDQIVVSDKFKHNNDGFKYFIDCKEVEIVKPLYIMKHVFRNQSCCVLDKYNKVWDKVKNTLNINFTACLFMMKNA